MSDGTPIRDGASDVQEASASPSSGRDVPEGVILIWQSLVARRVAYLTMMWQTPALGLTAQAFLLTLALAGEQSSLGRAIAAVLAGAIAIITLQLMAKHRFHEGVDKRHLARIEDEYGFARTVGFKMHSFDQSELLSGDGRSRLLRRFWLCSSFHLWMVGQLVFLAVSLLILVLVITGNAGLLTTAR